MTEFVSERVEINMPTDEVFDFLSDFTNFSSLMPEQIKNWSATENTCSFAIEGLAELNMRIASKSKASNIHIVADGKNPVDYTLDIFLFDAPFNKSKAEIIFNAGLNPFIKAMASKPLQNFVDKLAQKLQEHFSH